MSSDVPQPPTRDSLYPEPHHAAVTPGMEPAAPSKARNPWLWFVVVVSTVALLGTAWAGFAAGRESGTAVPVITNRDGDTINAIQADTGMCLQDIGKDGAVAQVVAVPCDVAHRAEVVASYTFTAEDFPGTDAARKEMLDYCGRVIQPGFSQSSVFQPGDWDAGVRWVAWAPTAKSWGIDERRGVCVAYRDKDMLGSFVGGTVTFVD